MFRNRIIFIALVLFVLGTIVLTVTFLLSPSVPVTPIGNENVNQVVVGGSLPNVNGGFQANRAGDLGVLPNVNIIGRTLQDSSLSDVADGGQVRTHEVVPSRSVGLRYVSGGGLSLYDRESRRFYQLTSGGQKIELSPEEFPSVESVRWSPDNQKAIIEFPDGTSVLKDFSNNSRMTLPREGKDFVFQGDSENVVFKYVTPDPDRNFVVAGDPAGADVKAVEHLGDKDEFVQTTYSPDGSVVALYRKPSGGGSEEIILIGQQEENFKSFEVQGIHFRGEWTPSGDRLLYSVASPQNQYNPALWLVDAKGDSIGLNNTPLGLSTTADSCVMASGGAGEVAYCAVPKELPAGAGLEPELFANRESFIYVVNLETGFSRLLADPVSEETGAGYPVQNLQVSDDGKTLYFVDGRTEKVYKIKIK